MIYIDPPYNTGNDSFVYNDNFTISNEEFSEISGQYDEDGNINYDIRKNNESNGKFHTDWLNMIYPRLKLAKDLLTDEGVIFISIDDHEVENLKKICNEIFGESNFVANIIWERSFAPVNLKKHFSENHDFILCYAKNIDYLTNLSMDEYEKAWSQFHSDFWEFKRRIFGKKQTDFCYAGKWSVHVNLATGDMKQCYWSKVYGNLFENIDLPIPEAPIGKCRIAHCYNGHMLMAAGLIPELVKKDDVRYGDLRNRVKEDGSNWLQTELKQAFNIRVNDENQELSAITKRKYLIKDDVVYYTKIAKYILEKWFHIKKK